MVSIVSEHLWCVTFGALWRHSVIVRWRASSVRASSYGSQRRAPSRSSSFSRFADFAVNEA